MINQFIIYLWKLKLALDVKKQKIWYDSKGNVLKKEYDKKNLERTRQRDKNRYHTDPSYRTKKILRSRLAKVLKGEKKIQKNIRICWYGITPTSRMDRISI